MHAERTSLTPVQRATLEAVLAVERLYSATAFDVAMELRVTPVAAAGRLRGLRKMGFVDSWKPDKEYSDPNLYWELTDEGKAALA